ncbi:hypothetical protein P3W24_09815 [Luteibacter sp. PPL201]|uniref:3-dehydroquinate dehydratase n=1 Tax=Luteibacter sahnii TaxID=3021977 RepID=A0ABT6BBA6_9GAMM|nr:hypothetical protein [Luteibacter sp. PPL193]MDY1547234.1 hypothetical protein [Luteibacter sp. PPL193]
MSIVVITSPWRDAPRSPAPPAQDAMWRLWERAQAVGVDLLWHPCRDVAELTAHLARSPVEHAELVLLDIDAAAVPEEDKEPLRHALASLEAPYIEVHEGSDETDASALVPGHPSLVSVVVPGDACASYDMALSIGLRYLGAGRRLAA